MLKARSLALVVTEDYQPLPLCEGHETSFTTRKVVIFTVPRVCTVNLFSIRNKQKFTSNLTDVHTRHFSRVGKSLGDEATRDPAQSLLTH